MQPRGKKILEQKNWFQHTDPALVDWDSIEAAMGGMTITQKWWTSKFVTGFCAMGKKMMQTRQRELSACPSAAMNLTAHILQCPQQSLQSRWDSDIKNLSSMLQELKTHPDIMEDISSSINALRLQNNPPTMLTQAGQHQMNLSWDNFMHGFIHWSWWMTQMLYYKQWKSNKSSHKWSLTLLQWILKIARGQWDHWNEALHQSNTQLILDMSANIESIPNTTLALLTSQKHPKLCYKPLKPIH